VRFVLDTHVLLWSLENDPMLSATARALLEDASHEPLLSLASLWEMAIKISIGKLERRHTITELVAQKLIPSGITLLPILPEHLDIVATLPFHHRDPFDRLMVAQCLSEGLPIVSRDGIFDSYFASDFGSDFNSGNVMRLW